MHWRWRGLRRSSSWRWPPCPVPASPAQPRVLGAAKPPCRAGAAAAAPPPAIARLCASRRLGGRGTGRHAAPWRQRQLLHHPQCHCHMARRCLASASAPCCAPCAAWAWRWLPPPRACPTSSMWQPASAGGTHSWQHRRQSTARTLWQWLLRFWKWRGCGGAGRNGRRRGWHQLGRQVARRAHGLSGAAAAERRAGSK